MEQDTNCNCKRILSAEQDTHCNCERTFPAEQDTYGNCKKTMVAGMLYGRVLGLAGGHDDGGVAFHDSQGT